MGGWGIQGIVIGQVLSGGQADQAGLKGSRTTFRGTVEIGDIITKVNHKVVQSQNDLLDLLDQQQAGDQVTVEYERNGRLNQTIVTLQILSQ